MLHPSSEAAVTPGEGNPHHPPSGFEVVLASIGVENGSPHERHNSPSSSSSRSLANSILLYDGDGSEELHNRNNNNENHCHPIPTSLRLLVRDASLEDIPEEEKSCNSDNDDETEQEHLVRFLVNSINELVEQEKAAQQPDPRITEDSSSSSSADNVMEALSMACLGTCGSIKNTNSSAVHHTLQPASPLGKTKSILRTKGDGRSPTEAGILSDRTVSFSRLEIHEFGMTLGDHPSAVSGPPVALDYSSAAATSPDGSSTTGGQRIVDVDEYERVRTPRRTRRHLKLTYQDKCATLQDKGFSLQELHDAWAEAIRIRKQRQETLKQTYAMMVWDDLWESTWRKYHRLAETLALA